MNPDFWTAIATVVVALFTIVLAVSGGIQAWLTRQAINLTRSSIELANKEYMSGHRPRIILRDVHYNESTGQIFYMLINDGGTPATIVESWILVEFIQSGKAIQPLRSVGHDELGRLTFAAGEMKDLTYDAPNAFGLFTAFRDATKIAAADEAPMAGDYYFTGAILYADDSGNRRRSVFRRQWDFARQSFSRIDDPDQEYAD